MNACVSKDDINRIDTQKKKTGEVNRLEISDIETAQK